VQQKRSLLLALALGVPGYGWLLVAPSAGPSWLRDAVLTTLLLALPVWVLTRVRDESTAVRPWLVPLTTGLAMFPLGHLVGTAGSLLGLGERGFAGFVGDVLVLVGYPFLLLGLLAALAVHVRGLRLTVCLDGLTGALAGAAVATLAIAPLLPAIGDGTWAQVPLLAFPFLDAALVAASLGALALVGLAHGRQFGLWAGALVALAAAHLVQVERFASGAAVPTWSHALVGLALALLSIGALGHGAQRPDRLAGSRALGVPALSSVAAVAVLPVAPDWQVTPLPTLLALATLVCAAARFVRAFLQLRELAAVKEMALTDELTGIPNRRALYLHLDTMLALADDDAELKPGDDGTFAVALIDLDHFKEVNDTLGHATGDALLKGVVARFSAKLEELETPYLFARLGGDEFAVVLHEATSRNAALVVGEALQESLAEPLKLPDAELHAHASIGLAVAPRHGRTRSEILFAADAAMYAAKTSGDAVRFHAPSHDEKTQQLGLSEELHRALDRRELVVEYLPVESAEGHLVGVEALVRWDHPERGLLLPADFLPAAERYRLTNAIAQRVLEIALGDLERWRAHGVTVSLTVNLSPSDLRDEAIVNLVAEALLGNDVPASALTLDIPEAALAEDPDRVTGVIRSLKGLGVRLALDDYGTGGTGLARLHELPFHALKLDGRFARDTAVDARSTGVVKSAIDLAHALGMRIVAEGVEDRRAAERLRELGCDELQGWHVGRPAAATEVEARMSRSSGGKHRLPVPEQSTRLPEQPAAPVTRPEAPRRR
jgi:diguanylate cyclase (GGDEF)-like protein